MSHFFTRLSFLILFLASAIHVNAQELLSFLQSQPTIKKVTEITGNEAFDKTYEIMIRQPLDYSDTTAGFFLQRVFVADKAIDQPVVFITEGYNADYAKRPGYINELSQLLDANQICVEHRYFGESTPDSIIWKYLTVENAANDHHRIVELFKKFYHGKWLNTGISKGGQTALAHRAFFPDDVEMTVAYVAPLNFGVEDGRHEPFLDQVGTTECRVKIRDFQREVLKRREKMVPLLKSFADSNQYTYPFSLNELLDYSVLEYSYAFWQWGFSCGEIPSLKSNDSTLFNHFVKVSTPDYFSYEGSAKYRPFFYQAARELGYYGYDTAPFSDLLSIKTTNGYLNRYMVPGNSPVQYLPQTSLKVKDFLLNQAENVILIYGETDPWSASAANVRKEGNNLKIVNPGGSHKTRILNLNDTQKESVLMLLKNRMK